MPLELPGGTNAVDTSETDSQRQARLRAASKAKEKLIRKYQKRLAAGMGIFTGEPVAPEPDGLLAEAFVRFRLVHVVLNRTGDVVRHPAPPAEFQIASEFVGHGSPRSTPRHLSRNQRQVRQQLLRQEPGRRFLVCRDPRIGQHRVEFIAILA